MTGTRLDATATAAAIRSGALTAHEAVSTALDRIEATRELNAFTVVRPEAALARAAEVDAGAVSGPLAGVPISVKDHVWLAGWPATNGSRALADFVPDRTAAAVTRLLDAGAVVVGKTNNPEFCYWGYTDNEVWGLTRNPVDPSRTPGGSSGGAAVSVADGAVPIAVATDGGGSIRIPSAFCGVYGLKPSFGLIPSAPGFRGWPTLSVTGPIAASVRDLALGASIMAGPSPADPQTGLAGGRDLLAAVLDPGLAGLRVAFSPDLGVSALDDDVRASFRAAIDALTGAGGRPVAAHPEPRDLPALWGGIGKPESFASEGALVLAHPELVGAEAARLALSGRDHSAADYLDAQRARTELIEHWEGFFEDYDVLLTPTLPVTAFEVGRVGPATVGGRAVSAHFAHWCSLLLAVNVAGLPAVSLPIAPGAGGRPVGLQVIGRRWADDVVLRAAAAIDLVVNGARGAG